MPLVKSKHLSYALLLTLGAIVGFAVRAAVDEPAPAYLIVSGTVLDAEGLELYREKAKPLARAAGIQVLARSEVVLLEGDWQHSKTVTVERFSSMQVLQDFWNSPGYREATQLRDGKFKADFVIAVEGKQGL